MLDDKFKPISQRGNARQLPQSKTLDIVLFQPPVLMDLRFHKSKVIALGKFFGNILRTLFDPIPRNMREVYKAFLGVAI